MNHRTSVFTYDNYRNYLRDVYLERKSLDPKYSHRFFAKAAGYKSASALLEVINGKKNLSVDGIAKFSKALKLTQAETQFFRTLVLFNQSSDPEEKVRFAKDLSHLKLVKKITPLSEAQYRMFDHWYYTAILELVSLPEFREDPKWIAAHVIPPISPNEASNAISELIQLGLLKRDEARKLVAAEPNITTPDEVSSTYIANWHREFLKKAADSITTIPRDKRDISGVYFAFSQQNVAAIKELIHKFRKEVLELATQQQDRDVVYQLNLQLFPVAEAPEGNKR